MSFLFGSVLAPGDTHQFSCLNATAFVNPSSAHANKYLFFSKRLRIVLTSSCTARLTPKVCPREPKAPRSFAKVSADSRIEDRLKLLLLLFDLPMILQPPQDCLVEASIGNTRADNRCTSMSSGSMRYWNARGWNAGGWHQILRQKHPQSAFTIEEFVPKEHTMYCCGSMGMLQPDRALILIWCKIPIWVRFPRNFQRKQVRHRDTSRMRHILSEHDLAGKRNLKFTYSWTKGSYSLGRHSGLKDFAWTIEANNNRHIRTERAHESHKHVLIRNIVSQNPWQSISAPYSCILHSVSASQKQRMENKFGVVLLPTR